jgi:hypothetical protein
MNLSRALTARKTTTSNKPKRQKVSVIKLHSASPDEVFYQVIK